jgi:hypothetical protein
MTSPITMKHSTCVCSLWVLIRLIDQLVTIPNAYIRGELKYNSTVQ